MYILMMSRKMVSIHEAAEFLGVAAQTLRRWEREGKLIPDERTPGGRRRYDLARLSQTVPGKASMNDLELFAVLIARRYGVSNEKFPVLLAGLHAALEAAQC
jgi:hypothetical protein